MTLLPYRILDNDGRPVEVLSPTELDREGTQCRSREAIAWMRYISERDGVPIFHGESGNEVRIRLTIDRCGAQGAPRGRRGGASGVGGASRSRWVSVDGYAPSTMTVYEYNGDAFHPNVLFRSLDDSGAAGLAIAEQYDAQELKRCELTRHGFRVVSVTSDEWTRFCAERRSEYLPGSTAEQTATRTVNAMKARPEFSSVVMGGWLDRSAHELPMQLVMLSRYAALSALTRYGSIRESVDHLSTKLRDGAIGAGVELGYAFSVPRASIAASNYLAYHLFGYGLLRYFGDDMVASETVRVKETTLSDTDVARLSAYIGEFVGRYADELNTDFRYGRPRLDLTGWTSERAFRFLRDFMEHFYDIRVSRSKSTLRSEGPIHFRWDTDRRVYVPIDPAAPAAPTAAPAAPTTAPMAAPAALAARRRSE